jgi:osmoprotectant transport system substrate-binding protein
VVVVVVALATFAAGCGGGAEPQAPHPEDAIRVGAFDFAESELLAEVYAQALERHGLPVARLGRIGSREVVEPALELGLVDVVPEYAGTMLSFVSLGTNEPTADSARTMAELRSALAPRGMVALDPASAQNHNAVVVTMDFAAENDVRTVSDLAPLAGDLVFGGPPECPERYFCLVGLEDRYDLDFGSFIPSLNAAAVAAGLRAEEIDVGLLFSTDPQLAEADLLALADDRGLQPAENVVPVARSAALDVWGPVMAEALNGISARLTTADLAELNARAAGLDLEASAIASDWLANR